MDSVSDMKLTPKGNKLTDEELAALLNQRIKISTGYASSHLSLQRERIQEYYDGNLPRKNHEKGVSYRTTDIRDNVNMAHATITEVFTGNQRPLQAKPNNPQDVDQARIETEYVNDVVFHQNDGFGVLSDVIKDGLMFRLGVGQAFWQKKVVRTEMQVPDITLEDAHQRILASDQQKNKWEDIKISKPDPVTGMVDLKYTEVEDQSKCVIESIPPEEFGVSPRSISIEEAPIVYRMTTRTKSDLLNAGFKKDLIEDIWTDYKVWLDTMPEQLQRFRPVDDTAYLGMGDELQDSQASILVFEIYTELDLTDSGKSELYRVLYAGNKILEKDRVSVKPFFTYAPIRRPHSLWGDSFAEVLVPTQIARTTLRRALLEHTIMTTNPRWEVMQGHLLKPSEMMDNRFGGLVQVTRPVGTGMQPLQVPALNPYIFQADQALADEAETMSGISKLSQGLNKDAISSQNSNDMVGQLVGLSQTRMKMMAREFGQVTMVKLFNLVRQIVIENETKQHIIDVCGEYVQVDPSEWEGERHYTVQLKVGYNEQQMEQQKYQQIGAALASDPVLSQGYGYPQRYNVARQALEAGGILDISNYLTPPAQVKPPPPDPKMVAEQQQMQAEIQIKQQKLKLEEMKLQLDHAEKMQEMQLKAAREQANIELEKQKIALETAKFKHTTIIDHSEIQLQEKAQVQNSNPRPIG